MTVGQDSLYRIDVPAATPTTASADVRWTFSTPSATGLNCSQVGVDHIYVYFDNGASPIADTACTGISGPVSEMSIVDVPDGQHSFAIHGTRGNQLVYYDRHYGWRHVSPDVYIALDVEPGKRQKWEAWLAHPFHLIPPGILLN